jgi:hypothetical protein
MEQFILDFDLKGRNYIILVKPHESSGARHFRAVIDEDNVIDFSQQSDGELEPDAKTDMDPVLINAIANRILEHINERNNSGFFSLP